MGLLEVVLPQGEKNTKTNSCHLGGGTGYRRRRSGSTRAVGGTTRLLVFSPNNRVLTNGSVVLLPCTVANNAFDNARMARTAGPTSAWGEPLVVA